MNDDDKHKKAEKGETLSMDKRQGPYKSRLSERDVLILEELYQLQAIRARDLVDTHFKGKEYGLQRLQRVCDKGYIERTFTVKNSGQRNQSVYSITDKGIEELLKLGRVTQERRARDLRLTGWEMLARIEVSKVAINLAKEGWEVVGSRDTKQRLGLPWNSNIQCLFVSTAPERKQYRVYYMGQTIKENTLTKLQAELEEDRNNSLILYKTEEILEETPAYLDFVKYYTNKHISLFHSPICLMPLIEWETATGGKQNFVLNALLYGGQPKLEQYLRDHYDQVKYGDNRYYFGNIIVEQEGKDYLVCNYLQRDKTALKMLAENLTIEEFRKAGKGAIVITWNGFVKEAQETIDNFQKRDFIEVKGITVRDIIVGKILVS